MKTYDSMRRCNLQRMTKAEIAIRDAVLAVEEAGCDTRLTDAVVLLQQAREKVADFVDGRVTAPIGQSITIVSLGGAAMPEPAPKFVAWQCEKCGRYNAVLFPEDGCDRCKGDNISARMFPGRNAGEYKR